MGNLKSMHFTFFVRACLIPLNSADFMIEFSKFKARGRRTPAYLTNDQCKILKF
jgi:hypothetical protein